MSQAEARSWWADVEHLREATERRRAHGRTTGGEVVPLAPDWRRAAAEHFDQLAEGGMRQRRMRDDHPVEREPVERRPSVSLDVAGKVKSLLLGDLEPVERDEEPHAGRQVLVDAPTSGRRFERPPRPPSPPSTPRFAPAVQIAPEPPDEASAERPALDLARVPESRPGSGRRTIEIRGQVPAPHVPNLTARHAAAEIETPVPRLARRRPSMHPLERLANRPDRLALWAFLLAVLLVVVAAASGGSGS